MGGIRLLKRHPPEEITPENGWLQYAVSPTKARLREMAGECTYFNGEGVIVESVDADGKPVYKLFVRPLGFWE
jgi:hypothetical protein